MTTSLPPLLGADPDLRAPWRAQPAPIARPSHAATLASQLTVLVPAYNEEASIGDTVRSLLAQTVRVAEVVVIDDGAHGQAAPSP